MGKCENFQTSRPVQELMSLKTASSASDEQRRMFHYLPKELAVIAIQTEAFRDIAEGLFYSFRYALEQFLIFFITFRFPKGFPLLCSFFLF